MYILDHREPGLVAIKGGVLEGFRWDFEAAVHLFTRNDVVPIPEAAVKYEGSHPQRRRKHTWDPHSGAYVSLVETITHQSIRYWSTEHSEGAALEAATRVTWRAISTNRRCSQPMFHRNTTSPLFSTTRTLLIFHLWIRLEGGFFSPKWARGHMNSSHDREFPR